MNKICFVMESHPDEVIGGAEIQTWQLAKELVKRGWDVSYVYESKKYKEAPQIIQDGIKLYRLKIRKRSMQIFNWLNLRRILKKVDADVYYQRMAIPYSAMLAYFYKKYSKPFVWVAASDADFNFFRYTKQLSINNKILNKIIKIIPSLLSDFLSNYGIKKATKIVVLTEKMQKVCKRKFQRESIIIKNGHPVPIDVFRKAFPPIILWLGTVKKQKRPEIFIKLAKALNKENCSFIIAGRIDDKDYEYFREFNIKEKKISYIENVDLKLSNELLAKSSILISTSMYEGYSNTFIQAWLRKTPVITLNADPDNVIKKKSIGFHSRTFTQLVADTKKLLEDRPLRERMGIRAREYAIKEHCLEKMVDKYINLCEDLIRKRNLNNG